MSNPSVILTKMYFEARVNDTYMVDPETILECLTALGGRLDERLMGALRLNQTLERLVDELKYGDSDAGADLFALEREAYEFGASEDVVKALFATRPGVEPQGVDMVF